MNRSGRVPDYLDHILEAIERIERYTADMVETAFLDSELVQDAVIRNIEIIGEAANNVMRVDPEFATRNDHIPWTIMYTMRNRVAHGYDKVDVGVVWKTIQRDLPQLYRDVHALRTALSAP